MKLKDIPRTATFAWDLSSSSAPLIATGAVAGALDESFSNESQLDIWAPQFFGGDDGAQGMRLGGEGKGPEGSITVGSRFNKIAWSYPSGTNARGVIAAGMETGEVNVFDPEKIIAGASADDARVFKSEKHTGPVRGVDFNPIQKNLMLTGAVNAEIYIHDLNSPTNAIPPGPLSTKLNEITSLQWNPTVSRVFAASSSSGFTSVWDLKAGKEIVSLAYGGGAAKGQEVVGGVAGLQMGKKRGMSDVCWHPELATRLITASEDDESPIIMIWDLRNTRAPERILSGHTKGVLSVSWCKQDADLLLSCGKDNRTLCWNPQTGEIIGELPPSNDWAFQTSWCPRNPDLLATASFDGHIGIHSLQTTHTPEQAPSISETATADDVFGALGQQETVEANVLSLKQPPKWLRRPVSASFGFGGLLASTSNLPGASGKHQSGVVHLRTVVTEEGILTRANALDETAGDKEKLAEFCDTRVGGDTTNTAWKALQTLFRANSRDELVQLLGFSKEEVAKQVEELIKKLPSDTEKRDSLVTFVEPDDDSPSTVGKLEATPSEISAASDNTKRTEQTEMTEQSLFDDQPGTPGADFFSSMAAASLRNPQLDLIPHTNVAADSSVAATIGSRASSVRSEAKDNTFRIYPSGESEVDKLITQALVLGDFASAVELCLASERFADALLLAVRGGPELLQSTQKAYFAKRTTSLPFLRVFQSIVTEDLTDIVQNADLSEWRVVFVVLCTFAKESDFGNLAEQLGHRLQFKWQMLVNSDSPETKASAKAARQDATLCYLAARKLEKVVGIWIDEMREEEDSSETTRYTAHAQALQSFIEKVAVFQAATGYVDNDLSLAESGAVEGRTYTLAGLYDRFYEYADLLATQGLVDIAAKYVKMTPTDYKGTGAAGSELDKARNRVLRAAGVAEGSFASTSTLGKAPQAAPAPVPATGQGYAPAPSTNQGYSAPAPAPVSAYNTLPPAQPVQSFQPQPAYTAPASQTYDPSPYAPAQTSQPGYGGYGSHDPQPQGYGQAPTYGQTPAYGQAPSQFQPQPSQNYGQNAYNQSAVPPPPRAVNGGSTNTPPPIPAALRRDIPGWNDAPSLAPPKRPVSVAKDHQKPQPIMSPFPMSSDPMQNAGSQLAPPSGMTPPPPRGQPHVLPPPPKGGPRPPSAQAVARAAIPQNQNQQPQQQQQQQQPQVQAPPPRAPPSNPPRAGPPPMRAGPPGIAGPPPPRALSPLGPGVVPQSMTSQIRPSPQTRPSDRAFSPPGAGGRIAGPPPPGRSSSIPPQSAQPSAPAPAPAPPAPVVAAPPPAKTGHPAGDRSHIPPRSRGIYDVLSNELNRVKNGNLPPHLKKIVDDTDRRLNILFDGLNNETVPPTAIGQMSDIAKAIAARDANAALALHVQLLTTATGDMTTWAPGVKQLIRLGL